MFYSVSQAVVIISGSLGGAICTYYLQKISIPVVAASAIVGFVGVLVEQFFPLPHLAEVIFMGSFVGMTLAGDPSYVQIIISAVLSGLIYALSVNLFPQYGGRLGAIAFIAVLICLALLSFGKN